MSNNEKHKEKVLKTLLDSIDEIFKTEGEINHVHRYGNTMIITFKNGNKYEQKLVSKYTSKNAVTD